MSAREANPSPVELLLLFFPIAFCETYRKSNEINLLIQLLYPSTSSFSHIALLFFSF
jgi:hypothetical protein